jgi:hypothetical protein
VSALIAVIGRTVLPSPLITALGALERFTFGIEDIVIQQGRIDRKSAPERYSSHIFEHRIRVRTLFDSIECLGCRIGLIIVLSIGKGRQFLKIERQPIGFYWQHRESIFDRVGHRV